MKPKNSIKPLQKLVTPARPSSSTIPLLLKLIRLMSRCAVTTISVRNGEVVSSVRQKLYSWGVFLFFLLTNYIFLIITTPPTKNGKNIPIPFLLIRVCLTSLCHFSVSGTLYSITSKEMTAYIELLKRVDEKAGLVETLDPGCKRVVLFLILHIIGAVFDICLHFMESINKGILSNAAWVVNTLVFIQYVILEIVFVFLSSLLTMRMRAIENRMVEIKGILGVNSVEEYWLKATDSSNPDIYCINKDASRPQTLDSLFLYIDLQESTRSAARIVEDCLGLTVLGVVMVSFVTIFVNLFFGINTIMMKDNFLILITVGRFLAYIFMFCCLSETCHSFYFADKRVTRDLHDAICAYTHRTRGSGDPRVLQLWSRLRAAAAHHPKYTAFRMLDINRELVCSGLQTALTYTIMLLQLKSGLTVDEIIM